jgi:hypothetical protein
MKKLKNLMNPSNELAKPMSPTAILHSRDRASRASANAILKDKPDASERLSSRRKMVRVMTFQSFMDDSMSRVHTSHNHKSIATLPE